MASGFNQLLQTMAQQDAFTGLLPLLLIFSIFYPVARKLPPFTGDDGVTPQGNMAAAILSAGAALYVTRFLMLNPFYQGFLPSFFGYFSVGMIGIMGLLVVTNFLGLNLTGSDDGLLGDSVLLVLIVSVAGGSWLAAGGFGPERPQLEASAMETLGFVVNSGLVWGLIAIGVLGAMTFAGSGGGDTDTGTTTGGGDESDD